MPVTSASTRSSGRARDCGSSRDPGAISSSRSPAKTPAARRLFHRRGRAAGGPPLHVHHAQEETIHALNGRYKVRIGDETFTCEQGGFAYLPTAVPHTFLNLTDEPGEVIVVYIPGGGHKFYEELGPLTRTGTPDRATSPRSSRNTT